MAKQNDTQAVPALAGLSREQLHACLSVGATLAEIKELAESGFDAETIIEMAPHLAAARAVQGSDQAPLSAIVDKIGEIAQSVQKQRPENVAHPDVSVRNPLGQRDNPNPAFPCKDVWFGGFPVHHEQCTREELELLRQIRPGEYTVTRVDDLVERVPVGFITDDTGKVSRINIGIKTGDEHKNAWPSLTRVLTEIVRQVAARDVVAA
jgi:hypothetical protein